MSSYTHSDKLDTIANSAINQAVRNADTNKCGVVTCAHIMCALQSLGTILGEKFTKSTGVTASAFRAEVKRKSLHGDYGRLADDKSLSINDCSEEAFHFIKAIMNRAALMGRVFTSVDLYNILMTEMNTEINEVLLGLGASIKDSDSAKVNKDDNPLEHMPITAKFANDLCNMAAKNMFDPITSRDNIIDQIVETLGRRQKGNPCLIGEPGVGKTSIVEGLAQRIVDGNVPGYLKNMHIISVDITGVVGGTKYRGDFEERLNRILYEVAERDDVILFFDEFHTLMGVGKTSGDGAIDAANILKPAISKGDIKIIGATTLKEYSKFIEADGAFERRIQPIIVDEPTVEATIAMLKKLEPVYSKYHNCEISNTVIEQAVKLSDRYITNRKLPDKAISVIDETAARLRAHNLDGSSSNKITTDDIRETIVKITGIDISDLNDNSREELNRLGDKLQETIIGQPEAISTVVKAIRRSKAGIKDPNRPIASFLFVGPTGVGKTELTKVLAEQFGGGIKKLIRFDMSEFMEKHAVSRLIGAPPGYVGFGDGGQLTEAVKRNPYSVIIFDEIEKAHQDIFNILLQVLDDGRLTDSEGEVVDFKNTIIIMTSNAGYGIEDNGNKLGSIGFSTSNSDKDASNKVKSVAEDKAIKALESTFRPEFLNRLDRVVVFNKLSKKDCEKIAKLELSKISKRLEDKEISISWDDDLVSYIAEDGFSDKYGARNIKRKAQEAVEDVLADLIIDGIISCGDSIRIGFDSNSNKAKLITKNTVELLLNLEKA